MHGRIATLDLIRGVAVMGILAANIAAFGLPDPAYFSPAALGTPSRGDLIAWALTFVLVEGKMRGLFSFLFGASMLLVIDSARAAGNNAAALHYRRMGWLFVFGLAHLYLFWWGDILAHYALVGCLAFAFNRLSARWLVLVGLACVALQTVDVTAATLTVLQAHAAAIAPGANADTLATWHAFATAFGQPLPADVTAELQAARGGYADIFAWRWAHNTAPLDFLPQVGAETLGYMLLGMAGLRSGFLTGAWNRQRYRIVAAIGIGIGIAIYAALALFEAHHGFDARYVFLASLTFATPVRPIMIVGYAALIILLMRPGGWLTTRVAAAGRMAFSNYLGTTIFCTTLFYGYGAGLFGLLSRASLYIVVAILWCLMLLWSKPWLDRYRYGPLEWLWRSLARFAWQPMRGGASATNRAQ